MAGVMVRTMIYERAKWKENVVEQQKNGSREADFPKNSRLAVVDRRHWAAAPGAVAGMAVQPHGRRVSDQP
jgi:hypothetical protein